MSILQRKQRRNRRGFSLVELVVSLLILMMVILIVLPGMIYYARAVKGIRHQQRLQQFVNLFIQQMNYDMTQTYEIVVANPNVATFNSLQTEYVADATQPTGFRIKRETTQITLVVRDADDDPDTIKDNQLFMQRIVRNADGDIIDQSEEEVLYWLSPLLNEDGDPIPYFQRVAGGNRDYIQLTARLGDRTIKRTEMTATEETIASQDDALSGPGYQGFVLEYILIPYNRGD